MRSYVDGYRPVPELEKRVELLPWNEQTWQDYMVLVNGRRSGYGPGPIPPSEVLLFQGRFYPGMDAEESAEHLSKMLRMDAAHRKFSNDRNERDASSSSDRGDWDEKALK